MKKKQKLMIESIKYITGNQKSMKIQGPTKQVKAFQRVLKASRNLYETLQRENVRLKQIENLVAVKNKAAQQYFLVTGSKWPF